LSTALDPARKKEETLTLGALCEFLRTLEDNVDIAGASLVQARFVTFTIRKGKTAQTSAKANVAVGPGDLRPAMLDGANALSLEGREAVPAKVLLAALEPCIEKHAAIRVCVGSRRALLSQRHLVSLTTDYCLLRDDPRSEGQFVLVQQAIAVAKMLARSRALAPASIASAASALMPPHWTIERCLIGDDLYALDGPDDNIRDLLPRFESSSLDPLFICTTVPLGDAPDHGCFAIWVPIEGLTREALVEVYGHKPEAVTPVERLLAMAAAHLKRADGDRDEFLLH
jgi:hypothetical protein